MLTQFNINPTILLKYFQRSHSTSRVTFAQIDPLFLFISILSPHRHSIIIYTLHQGNSYP